MSKERDGTTYEVRELVTLVREEDGQAFERLLSMYEPMINAAMRRYLPEDADADDARQEALAGFYRAALTFDLEQSEVAFGFYAKVCVTNALISHAREIARRARRAAANIEYDDYMRYYAGNSPDPAQQVAERESTEALQNLIKQYLSPYENRVWDMHMAGVSTQAISEKLGKPVRSIDNALYRIRRKLRAMLGAEGRYQ